MHDKLPTVTILIAARPGQAEVKALESSRALDYPSHLVERIVARGTQPSAQRNAGIRAARGQWIYFLDDDSMPCSVNLKLAEPYLRDESVQMIGGPNLCPREAPPLEQLFSVVLSSWLAFGPSRARYARVGASRATGEKELILCNLLARKETLLELGGFNEALYPNEENALMDELQKKGAKLIYDPDIYVLRRPRATIKAFCKMLFTYGRGRAEQFRLHPTAGSLLNFIPPFFCMYLLAVLVTLIIAPAVGRVFALPLLVYVALVIGERMLYLVRGSEGREPIPLLTRLGRTMGAMPFVMLTHLLYGAGFWRGLVTRLRPAGAHSGISVQLERVTPLAE